MSARASTCSVVGCGCSGVSTILIVVLALRLVSGADAAVTAGPALAPLPPASGSRAGDPRPSGAVGAGAALAPLSPASGTLAGDPRPSGVVGADSVLIPLPSANGSLAGDPQPSVVAGAPPALALLLSTGGALTGDPRAADSVDADPSIVTTPAASGARTGDPQLLEAVSPLLPGCCGAACPADTVLPSLRRNARPANSVLVWSLSFRVALFLPFFVFLCLYSLPALFISVFKLDINSARICSFRRRCHCAPQWVDFVFRTSTPAKKWSISS